MDSKLFRLEQENNQLKTALELIDALKTADFKSTTVEQVTKDFFINKSSEALKEYRNLNNEVHK